MFSSVTTVEGRPLHGASNTNLVAWNFLFSLYIICLVGMGLLGCCAVNSLKSSRNQPDNGVIELECFSNKMGALAHHAVTVRNWLNSEFNEHWIGRDGPILWLPRSPDLIILDFYLWGRLKQIVYREPLENDEEQKNSGFSS
ncbi:hypothetical protein NQ318_009997 [Aromia moschata]|uniref:Uncharacterized protein n=1 Tax=Aromia moschata TaxID=1265417 RepID=A0AAV8Y9P0_9CUCU|nr:hypothetical protein NQ318_009997 [Aromia moschata]